MNELWTANDVWDDHAALQKKFDQDGFLFLRGVLDTHAIATLKAQVTDVLVGLGYATRSGDDVLWTGVDMSQFGAHPAELHERFLWERFVQQPAVASVFERIFGEAAWFLPMGQYQVSWPGKPGAGKRIHQDGYYNRGLEFRTFWIPLLSIPEEVGGVSLVPRAHHNGMIETQPPSNPYLSPGVFPDEAWYRADYAPGDVLVFHAATPHCGLANRSTRMRLSIDVRAQGISTHRPVIGTVERVDGDVLRIAEEGAGATEIRIDSATLVRTDEPRPVPLEEFVGHRVVAAVRDGKVTLLRWASAAYPPRQ